MQVLPGLLSWGEDFWQELQPSFKRQPCQKRNQPHYGGYGRKHYLSAMALVLVPKGMESFPLLELIIVASTLLFYWIDKTLAEKGSKMATLLTMCIDFIPEANVLGQYLLRNIAQPKPPVSSKYL